MTKKTDNSHSFEFGMNAAGDWELTTSEYRYRIEEWSGRFWIYRKPVEMSAHSEFLHCADSLEDAKALVERNATKQK